MVVWCCATANTKPRFQPSDDAEYCLYVKLSASAGLTTKTSTAHNSGENFATMLPPSRAFLRPAHESNAYHRLGFPEREEMRSFGLPAYLSRPRHGVLRGRGEGLGLLERDGGAPFRGMDPGSARNWSFSASLNVASYARRARAS